MKIESFPQVIITLTTPQEVTILRTVLQNVTVVTGVEMALVRNILDYLCNEVKL